MNFKCAGDTTQLQGEKFFSMVNSYTRGQLRLRSWFPNSEEVPFNFVSLFILDMEALYIFQLENSKKMISITLYQSEVKTEEEVSSWTISF